MDISLSNNLQNILKSKVAEGIFDSMNEAVTFAVQFTFGDDKVPQSRIDELNVKIEEGWQDMEQGKGRRAKEVFADLRKKYV